MKGMNKRGDENVGFGSLLMVIIGVLGLVLVGLFVYNSWSKINDTSKLVPEDRTMYAGVCEQTLALGEQGYCKDFKEVKIGKEKQYMNCQYLNKNFALNISEGSVTCTEADVENYCKFLNTTKVVGDKVNKTVNGENCYLDKGILMLDTAEVQ